MSVTGTDTKIQIERVSDAIKKGLLTTILISRVSITSKNH
jgi:hypothetical protein